MRFNLVSAYHKLYIAGYDKIPNGTWIRHVDRKHRFHATIAELQDGLYEINLHYDTQINPYNPKYVVHKASESNQLVKEEVRRITFL